MNKTLQALMTKIQWQRNELNQQIQTLEKQMGDLRQQWNHSRQRTEQACAQPARLVPEQEMARLNFMICQQQQQDELQVRQQGLQEQQALLSIKKHRLDTELRMLEKYQGKQQEQQRQQGLLAEQHRADEWTLQRGEQA